MPAPPSTGGEARRRRTARIALVVPAARVATTASFDTEFSSRLGPGLLPYLSSVGEVTHGRTPLVDTASRAGWGAIDVLGAIFAVVPLGYGTLALVVSAAAAACALLVLSLAICVIRPLGAALAGGVAAVRVGSLAAPLPDAAVP